MQTEEIPQPTPMPPNTPSTGLIILSVIFSVAAGFLLWALLSYDASDPAWRHNNGSVTHNALGMFGAWYSDISFSLFGKLSYIIPLGLLAFAVNIWRERAMTRELFSWRLLMIITAILSGSVLWTKHDPVLINSVAHTGGGAFGAWLTIGLEKSIQSVSILMMFTSIVFIISLSIVCNIPWLGIAEAIGNVISSIFAKIFGRSTQASDTPETEYVQTAPESDSVNEDLQAHIRHLNAKVSQKKQERLNDYDQPHQYAVPERPQFTIDRYQPEADLYSEAPAYVDAHRDAPARSEYPTAQPAPHRDSTSPVNSFNAASHTENQRPAHTETRTIADRVKPMPAATQPSPLEEHKEHKKQEPQRAEPSFFSFNDSVDKSSSTTAEPTADEIIARLTQQQTSVTSEPQDTETNTFTATTWPETVPEEYEYVDIPEAKPQQIAAHSPERPIFTDIQPQHNAVDNYTERTHSHNFDEPQELPQASPAPPVSSLSAAQQPTYTAPQPLSSHESWQQPTAPTEPMISMAPPAIDTEYPQSSENEYTTHSTATQKHNTLVQPRSHTDDHGSNDHPNTSDNNIIAETVIQPQSIGEEHYTTRSAFTDPTPGHSDREPSADISADLDTLEELITPSVAATAAPTGATIGKVYDSSEDAALLHQVEAERSYELPSISLLDTPPPQKNAYTEDDLAQMAGVLESTLRQFNINATVMHVSPGPVITRFELELAPGIQAKKITNLSQDLARALAVSRVRVEEVIPGSSYVGLEVPNKQRQTVYFRDVVCSKAFQQSTSPLTISLGSDTSGKPQVVDLMKMPHALVAGTTGSGKSVCINVMLLSMLYKASPQDLRLILVDPKMLEMSMYEDIPHLLTPVITDMTEAENALTWAVGEMERRYQLMAALKVRKIDAFNEQVDAANARGEPIKDPLWQPDEQVGYTHHPSLERLPFIVIVIDELADMMMVVGKQVEQLIARLTQKARAAGIHVVLATQRPSTDVLTGLIKANVPTRIAFQVSSGTDSRVIIDGVGAEKLLGHGDMLYVPPGASHPQRFHGAFVGDSETDRITDYLRSTGEPDYIDGITGKQAPESLGAFGAAEASESKEDIDPLYEEAVQIVIETNKASISSVQRQLRIGYNRAARMIEDMQAQGIVSAPVNGTRKVLGRR